MYFLKNAISALKICLTLGVVQWFLVSVSLHSLPLLVISYVIAEDDYDYDDEDYDDEDLMRKTMKVVCHLKSEASSLKAIAS